jgi:hypothetical protein
MGALRRHRGIAAWLALFALVGHLFATALCPPTTKHGAIDIPPELAAAYVLCSGNDVPSGDPAPAKSKTACDMCLAAATLKLLFAIAAIVTILAPAVPRPWRVPTFVLAFKDFLRRDGLQSRAPPLPA